MFSLFFSRALGHNSVLPDTQKSRNRLALYYGFDMLELFGGEAGVFVK